VRQHPHVAAGSRGRCGAPWVRRLGRDLALAAFAVSLAGCDSTVTSVGAWAPIVAEPEPEPDPDPPEPSNTIYLEAESGELSVVSDATQPTPSGFAIVPDVSASGGQYLEPPLGNSDSMPGPARALYRFNVASDGDFVIWGRIYSPNASQNRFWFQVDGGEWYRWRISTGQIWYWDDFHDNINYFNELLFPLGAGPHELQIASCTSGAKLDRLYITSQGDEPPGNDTPCDPPHSIEVGGECLPSCGSLAPPGMNTTCQGCEGQPELVGAYDCPICCVAP
jgi:hypothetical protein